MELTGKKILIIVENLPVPLDRRVWQEACALRDAGCYVSIICPKMRGYNKSKEEINDINIYRHRIILEASGIIGFIIEYISALWGETKCTYNLWKKEGFDLIHICNPPDLLFLVAWPYKLFFGVKVLYDVHDLCPEMFCAKFGKKNPLYWVVRVAEKCTLSIADVVVATNNSVFSIIKKRKKKKNDNIYVVRTSPQISNTKVDKVLARKNRKEYLVGYIGVMGDSDGLDYLLRAIAYIVYSLKRTDIQFCLMGTGPQFKKIEQMRIDLNVENYVEMPGKVSDQYLSETLYTMDLGICCDPINSYNDHCTMNKTLEYMAFGKPQVMFDIKEGRFSAGDSAVYVDENCSKKLGQSIVRVLDDPNILKKMGKIGYERLHTELSWERSRNLLIKAYEDCLITTIK